MGSYGAGHELDGVALFMNTPDDEAELARVWQEDLRDAADHDGPPR
jgi:hypothetical protein